MKAFKVFETQEFERGIDPMDSMKLGDVRGRLLKIRKTETVQAMEEILNTYGGDGPFFYDEDEGGFKIGIYLDTPNYSKFKIYKDGETRYYMEYAYGMKLGEESFFVGWEQEDTDEKWKDRQWTSKIPGTGEGIKTTEKAKEILIDYIVTNSKRSE